MARTTLTTLTYSMMKHGPSLARLMLVLSCARSGREVLCGWIPGLPRLTPSISGKPSKLKGLRREVRVADALAGGYLCGRVAAAQRGAGDAWSVRTVACYMGASIL